MHYTSEYCRSNPAAALDRAGPQPPVSSHAHSNSNTIDVPSRNCCHSLTAVLSEASPTPSGNNRRGAKHLLQALQLVLLVLRFAPPLSLHLCPPEPCLLIPERPSPCGPARPPLRLDTPAGPLASAGPSASYSCSSSFVINLYAAIKHVRRTLQRGVLTGHRHKGSRKGLRQKGCASAPACGEAAQREDNPATAQALVSASQLWQALQKACHPSRTSGQLTWTRQEVCKAG